jgi:pantoate--beta-alanine ligase
VARGTDSVDYAVIRDARTLEPIERVEAGRAVALIAARVGRTRLIDNAVLT